MTDEASQQALADAVARAAQEYAGGILALTRLVSGAHHLTATSRGQDLRPIVLAYAALGMALFPEGSDAHTQALRLRDLARGEAVAQSAKTRRDQRV